MNCERCGIELSEQAIEKRKSRGIYDGRCFDCRANPAYEIKYNGETCRPWRGRVDEDFNPIDEKLRPYLPGVRKCGHKDCVKKEHILSNPELERVDISYRTGKKATLESIAKELVA